MIRSDLGRPWWPSLEHRLPGEGPQEPKIRSISGMNLIVPEHAVQPRPLTMTFTSVRISFPRAQKWVEQAGRASAISHVDALAHQRVTVPSKLPLDSARDQQRLVSFTYFALVCRSSRPPRAASSRRRTQHEAPRHARAGAAAGQRGDHPCKVKLAVLPVPVWAMSQHVAPLRARGDGAGPGYGVGDFVNRFGYGLENPWD